MPLPFFGGNMTPDRRQMLAQTLMQQGQQANNGTFLGALAAGLGGGLSGYQYSKADAENEIKKQELARQLSGNDQQAFAQLQQLPLDALENQAAMINSPAYKLQREQFDFEKDYKGKELALKGRQVAMGGDLPSAVREYQYYNGLDDAGKREFLSVKRAQQALNLGGTYGVLDATGNIANQIPKTIPPEQLPEAKYNQAMAGKQGELDAERLGAKTDKSVKASTMLDLVKEAELILPEATSGAMQQGVTSTANFFGKSTDASKADRRLQVISAGLTSNVPRFEGPQGVLDVQLYKQAAADVGNSSIPYEDRMAALQTIKDLQLKNIVSGQNGGSQPMPQSQPTSGGKIKFLGFE